LNIVQLLGILIEQCSQNKQEFTPMSIKSQINQNRPNMLSRRKLLALGGALALGVASTKVWPAEGIFNACLADGLPNDVRDHEIFRAAWEGINPAQYWDCHAHLIGIGDSNSGTWVNPNMRSFWHPIQRAQFSFYLNAACANKDGSVDEQVVARLRLLLSEFPVGAKSMLLAFDYYHDQNGNADTRKSTFHTPNAYASKLAQLFPDRFEWIASIHPYRKDAVSALTDAIAHGARAIKWLPPAMGIDPSSPKCDAFYAVLAQHGVPLLSHAGHEHAVDAADLQHLGNPLLLRRPLEAGVRVIIAHCASVGSGMDIDKGPNGPETPNIDLFARLMAEQRYENKLFSDISAITQINRDDATLRRIFSERDWHPRLLNGSDYPLPGVVPLFSLRGFVKKGYLIESEAKVLTKIREHNAL